MFCFAVDARVEEREHTTEGGVLRVDRGAFAGSGRRFMYLWAPRLGE